MVMPYLSFQGNCEEAFRFYEKAFGGQLRHLSRYGVHNEQQKDKVMHAELMLTETGGISGADAMWPVQRGNAVQIHVHLDTEAKARAVFSALAEAGTVVGELQANPPPDDSGISGAVADRFGFTWILSAMIGS